MLWSICFGCFGSLGLGHVHVHIIVRTVHTFAVFSKRKKLRRIHQRCQWPNVVLHTFHFLHSCLIRHLPSVKFSELMCLCDRFSIVLASCVSHSEVFFQNSSIFFRILWSYQKSKLILQINNFRGDLSHISAETATLVLYACLMIHWLII